ncbi:hypothetical protein Droror1_Dr00012316 [Drosera rotundifolia]
MELICSREHYVSVDENAAQERCELKMLPLLVLDRVALLFQVSADIEHNADELSKHQILNIKWYKLQYLHQEPKPGCLYPLEQIAYRYKNQLYQTHFKTFERWVGAST